MMNRMLTDAHASCDRARVEHVRLSADELRQIVSDPNRWVSDTIASQVTGIPRGSLRRFRHENRGPRYAKSSSNLRSGSVRYKVAWLLEYIERCIVETSDSQQPQEAA